LAIENEFVEVVIDGCEEIYQVSRCSSQLPGKIKTKIKGAKKKTELRI
jgi:hypothetical protein